MIYNFNYIITNIIGISEKTKENISKATKNSIWIHNKKLRKSKRIKEEKIKKYLEEEWELGRK